MKKTSQNQVETTRRRKLLRSQKHRTIVCVLLMFVPVLLFLVNLAMPGLIDQVILIIRSFDSRWIAEWLMPPWQKRTRLRILEILSNGKSHTRQQIQQTLERNSIVIRFLGIEDALHDLVIEGKVKLVNEKYVVVIADHRIAVRRKRIRKKGKGNEISK